MRRMIIILFLAGCSLVSAKSRVGFYPMLQEEGLAESQWIGIALSDLIAENVKAGDRAEIVNHEAVWQEAVKSDLKITDAASINAFEKLKTNLALDFLVTGSYKHQPDKSLSLTLQIHDFKENKTTPLAVQGYSNDIPTIISFIIGKVVRSLNLTTDANELINYRAVEPPVPPEFFSDYYKGIAMMHSGNYPQAAIALEEAYKNNLDNKNIKSRYDLALEYLYGDGIFAMELLVADQASISEFRKQYITGKKIALGFAAQITGSSIELNGSYYSLDLDLLIKIDPKTMSMVNEAIKIFQTTAKSKVKNDVYNPNAKPELADQMEKLFERNIGNAAIIVNCYDKKGNLIFNDTKSLKIAFDFRYKDDVGYTDAISYKKVFTKTGEQKAQITLLNMTREIIKKIDKITVSVR